ncbi:hypothetical protein MGYG_07384 [Nannizzia gypsea CBS 118893]|uniref:Secreted protein n=1 Tax=Arthroderma gypseum (strain ATCC MYA-4604 / CBS 118893) TaxID=535722 RepID=E4V302_ARTGP|nr:hypothetical protein MGYG_07384 [Nannizzia gypsea CBS 118893]EFR04376.1 hypothetical protein MGYG_07384 [Nannizzia gypsea CBS 118893]
MQILLVVALCAFVARISAATPPQPLYTLITSKEYGLNLTRDIETGEVGFQSGSFSRHWIDVPVSQGVKNWHCFRSSAQKELQRSTWWIRFENYISGQAATTYSRGGNYYAYHPSLFEIEKVGDTYYIVSLEPSDPNRRLAWTIENNSTTSENFLLKLRPYSRSSSQKFTITQEPGDPIDMLSNLPPVA